MCLSGKLSDEQEKRLNKFIKYRARIGNGVTRQEISRIVKEVLDKAELDSGQEMTDEERLWRNNSPPYVWVSRYVKRFPDLAVRTPEHLGHQRKCVSESRLRRWFKDLEEFLLAEKNISASDFLKPENSHRIFNADETGFPLSGGKNLKIIAEKGVKNVYATGTESKEQITVL